MPVSDKNMNSTVDDRFGRCPFFCLYNTESGQIDFLENNLKNGSGGVGPQVVEFLINKGVNRVYAVEFGPKAKDLLDKLKIETQVANCKQTVQEIIKLSNL